LRQIEYPKRLFNCVDAICHVFETIVAYKHMLPFLEVFPKRAISVGADKLAKSGE
jgi:hypothetical protein